MGQAEDYARVLKAALVLKIEQGASATDVAAVATRALAAIGIALNPVIGKAGVAALYKRSIYLAALSHPWLSGSRQGEIDMSALGGLLAEQSASGAAEAGTAVLQTFYGLLASLVGDALTDRLLHSVWTDL